MLADVACPCITQIQAGRLLPDGGPAGVETVQIGRVGTTDEAAEFARGFIRQAQECWLPGLGSLQNVIGEVGPDRSKGERINLLTVVVLWCDRAAIENTLVEGSADRVHDLGGIELLVTTEAHQQRLEGLIVQGRHEQQHLHHLARIPAFGVAEAFDAAQARGWNRFLRAVGKRRCGGWDRNSLLLVGGVLAVIADQDQVFPGIRRHHELLGGGTADRSAIGIDRDGIQATTFKDAAVGLIHHAIGLAKIRFAGMEGVRVLHDEFAASHQAKAGTDLVAKFGLDLIEVHRKLPV